MVYHLAHMDFYILSGYQNVTLALALLSGTLLMLFSCVSPAEKMLFYKDIYIFYCIWFFLIYIKRKSSYLVYVLEINDGTLQRKESENNLDEEPDQELQALMTNEHFSARESGNENGIFTYCFTLIY